MSTDSVAADQIRAFVERILRLKEEAKSINDDIKEVYAEAKGNGFDKTVLGKLVNYIDKRAKDPNAVSESEAIFGLYLAAYDGASIDAYEEVASHTHAYAREDEHDADGVIIETASAPEGGHSSHADEGLAGPAWTADAQPANIKPAPITAPEAHPPEASEASDGSASDPTAAPVATNVTPMVRHNPETHFLSSKGLPRLHGCLKPDACGGSHRALCGSCVRAAGGSAA